MTQEEEIEDVKRRLAYVTSQRDSALMKLGFDEQDIKVVNTRAEEDGFTMQLEHDSLHIWAISMVDAFINRGAINFASVGVRDPRTGDKYEVVMQKVEGKGPAELYGEAMQRIEELEAQLHGRDNA